MALLKELGLVSVGHYKYVSPDGLSMNLALHRFADAWRQIVKRLGQRGRSDLERGSHVSFWQAGGVMALADFAAGLVEPGFHLVGEFKLVFEKIINPRADFFNLSARKFWQNRSNFQNRAPGYQDTRPQNGNPAIQSLSFI